MTKKPPPPERPDLEPDEEPARAGEPGVVIGGKAVSFSDLYLATASQTRDRVEETMPGTDAIPRILTLVPPPIDPELVRPTGDDSSRDYGPDATAEYSLAAPGRGVFAVGQLNAAITRDLRRYFANPTFYVRTPQGRVTYMVSSEAPAEATEIIAGWHLRDGGESAVETIYAGAQGLMGWLGKRPEGFAAADPDRAAIAARHAVAQRIIAIGPNDIGFYAWPKTPNQMLDGRALWRTLHALGLKWGDMDQFQWSDPTGQTDYLFWAEADDGEIGYALPEEIAAGRQHFRSVLFTFNVARSPNPAHVLGQMTLAATVFAAHMNCGLTAMVDHASVEGPAALEAAVRDVVARLEACGVKPGSSSVCMLR
jgi:hypothetical protein